MERQEYSRRVNHKETSYGDVFVDNDPMFIEKMVGITLTLSSPEIMASSALRFAGIIAPEFGKNTNSQEYEMSFDDRKEMENSTNSTDVGSGFDVKNEFTNTNQEKIDNEEYLETLSWRVGKADRVLDSVRDKIKNDMEAEQWCELKTVVAHVNIMNDPYTKVDMVIELEQAVYEFIEQLNRVNIEQYPAA